MEEIYEALATASQPFTLPSPWCNIPCDPAFRRLPADTVSLLAELRNKFSDENLIKAGVAKIDAAEKTVALHPDLVVVDTPIWFIRPKPDQKASAVVAQMRTLRKGTWALASAMNARGHNPSTSDATIVVAYSMADLAILESVGIAAVPGGSWSQLSKQHLDYLRWAFQLRFRKEGRNSTEGDAPEEEPSKSCTLANWSLANLDCTDVKGAATSWSYFVELHEYLDLSLEAFGLWKPSEMRLRQFSYQLKYLDIEQIRASLLNSMEVDSRTIDAELFVEQPPACSIADAHRAWLQAGRDEWNEPGRKRTYERLCELHDRHRFDPLIEEALQAQNALERNAEVAVAETSRLLQPMILSLTERIRRSIGEKGVRTGRLIDDEELEHILKLADRLIALTQEVRVCRRNQSTKTRKSAAVHSKPVVSNQKKSPR